jgi:hypothetical protein
VGFQVNRKRDSHSRNQKDVCDYALQYPASTDPPAFVKVREWDAVMKVAIPAAHGAKVVVREIRNVKERETRKHGYDVSNHFINYRSRHRCEQALS